MPLDVASKTAKVTMVIDMTGSAMRRRPEHELLQILDALMTHIRTNGITDAGLYDSTGHNIGLFSPIGSGRKAGPVKVDMDE